MYPLSQTADFQTAIGITSAAQTTVNGTAVDMEGFDGVLFILILGTVTDAAVITLLAQGSATSNGASPTQEATTAALTALSSSAGLMVLDVNRPVNRYVLPQVTRATQNAGITNCIAIRYKAKNPPVAVNAAVLAQALGGQI
ncbi:hypothetical protein [Fimbriiglobus ruber]|uniref:Phage protein n=1 Tax=Fimbriiglobus ruber TaxID=1908690 RepID=A0A225D048_9BACT|nr:hypothetical protein [Fimbriiglobus ruber]OWK34961.1 hypothetical protein FRUB_09803 [Fimbriiglobus ruber]